MSLPLDAELDRIRTADERVAFLQGYSDGLHAGDPIGTCMVSSEGACAAYYNFGRLHREAAVTLGRR